MFDKLLLCVCLALVANASVHKLKVNTLAGKSVQALREGNLNEFKKYHKKTVSARLNKHSSSRASRLANSQPISDYQDYFYIVNATVGTPPQPFQLLLDTYDGTTWVPDISCPNSVCGCGGKSDPCYVKNKFDRRESTTFKTDSLPYSNNITGNSGIFSVDTIGLASNLQVKQVTFGLVDKPFSILYAFPYDGYLSLSYKTDVGEPSIVEKAFEQKLIEAPIFTLFLITDGPDSKNQNGGQLTIGAADTENCSPDISYVPVYRQNWVFDVLKTEISRNTKAGSWTGVTDPVTATIDIPADVFFDIVDSTGATLDFDDDVYVVDCNVKFDWTITLANQNKITINEKIAVAQTKKNCYLLFESSGAIGLDFIFGAPFTHNYCQVFDMNGRTGFSQVLN